MGNRFVLFDTFPQTLFFSSKGMLRDIAGRVRSSTIVGTLGQRFSCQTASTLHHPQTMPHYLAFA